MRPQCVSYTQRRAEHWEIQSLLVRKSQENKKETRKAIKTFGEAKYTENQGQKKGPRKWEQPIVPNGVDSRSK